MKALYVAAFAALISSAVWAATPASDLPTLSQACRAAVAAEMGRDPSIMRTAPHSADALIVSYRRPDDNRLWRVHCSILARPPGSLWIAWATVRDDGTIGRPRTDGRFDNQLGVRRAGQEIVVEITPPSGVTYERRFPLRAFREAAASTR